MRWYKSLSLIATGAALLGGCSNGVIKGEVMYENLNFDRTRCEGIASGGKYIIYLKDEDKFVRGIVLGGKPCLLSLLKKDVKLGDTIILRGDKEKEWLDGTDDYVELKEYKIIKNN